ncbi:MAG: class I SAM-dependent methyltransferase [Candidatus Omnitrophica bacterium]|nr:class I SAM-dependent methyltransferase [Candidatus Omnitrophota bacterium]
MNIFNRYYKKYDAWYEKNKFAYLSELEAIREVLPKEGKGLEVGVGTGRFAHALGIAMGIDPSRNMIDIAARRGVTVRWGFGEDLPFFEGTFDYAAIIITLCFVQNPLKVLQESRRVLKKNGKLIVGIIDKDSFLGEFYQRKKSLFYKQANFFSIKEVTDLLKVAGFNRFSFLQTIFQLPDKMKSIEKPQKGFGKGGFVVIDAQVINNGVSPRH